jgi:hypothetical protein
MATDEKFELIAKLAQRYVADCPAVILGSGLSIPYNLPSMSDLANELIGRIKIDDKKWAQFSDRLNETKDLERTLQEIELSDLLLVRVVKETWALTNERDLAVYYNLIAKHNDLELSRLLKYLMRTANPCVSVITTNYDRLAEYAADLAEANTCTGFSSGWIQRFLSDESLSRAKNTYSHSQGQIEIWKVHGSLDWFTDASGDPIAIPLASKLPDNCKPLIVTPGVSKYREVHKYPFRTVMSRADKALQEARCYLCVGYGFNDEHVQPILIKRVHRDKIPIVVVTKCLTNAARRLLLDNPCHKFLILEEKDGGTNVYYPDAITGDFLPDCSIWDFPNFLNMLWGR